MCIPVTRKKATRVKKITRNIKMQSYIAKITVQKQANENGKFISQLYLNRKDTSERNRIHKNMNARPMINKAHG